MEMFLMVACISLFGLAVTAISFGVATREEPPAAETQPEPAAEGFFANIPPLLETQPRIPIEALLLQIENHVRLEQAAAESFLATPNAALLHTRTVSPLMH